MHTKECAEIKHILKSSRGPVYRRLGELAVQVEPVEAWMLSRCHFWRKPNLTMSQSRMAAQEKAGVVDTKLIYSTETIGK
jgi:hypothetical protein